MDNACENMLFMKDQLELHWRGDHPTVAPGGLMEVAQFQVLT